jgi:hypothetical protein
MPGTHMGSGRQALRTGSLGSLGHWRRPRAEHTLHCLCELTSDVVTAVSSLTPRCFTVSQVMQLEPLDTIKYELAHVTYFPCILLQACLEHATGMTKP